jgi:hypothetical protein
MAAVSFNATIWKTKKPEKTADVNKTRAVISGHFIETR